MNSCCVYELMLFTQGNTESQLHASSVAFTQNSIAEANSPTSDYYSGETESHRSATKISDQSSSDSAETKAGVCYYGLAPGVHCSYVLCTRSHSDL